MILDDLVAATRRRLVNHQALVPPVELAQAAQALPAKATPGFTAALADHFGLIAEIKQASPSKGVIAGDFPYLRIAQDYAAAGVDAISCLTEPDYFHGSLAILKAVTQAVTTPVLRKDFVIDRYMIDEAKVAGARLVLLIVAILSDVQLAEYAAYAERLGLEVLIECHNESEIARALALHPRLIGINNRDLTTFTVDLATCIRLRPLVPSGVAVLAESGIQTPAQLARLRRAGLNGALIGETLMRASDRGATIAAFREAVR
ncbi:indole-3-glycerol phosphate synthase TrpC [Lacticaseibacillus parakribbianus]|uniref:indole-3-glycerol phosphate synthase TrpC n=1 Tax=Lacticaseibacillus parakribbianus TaxID=2970927 RepID=UPI0021CB8468|nr:indole-3-glycerol phosphate synthase TrpC [Lacticaseibacillus parakribbianus]